MPLQVPLSTEESITYIAYFLVHIILLFRFMIFIKKNNLSRITRVRVTRVTPHRVSKPKYRLKQ
jgi:hypothetical protein